jgi:hypothetical protein
VVYDETRQPNDRLERQVPEVFALAEPMERRIQVGSRVARQLCPTEVELGPPAVALARLIVVEDREDAHGWEPGVGGHPVGDLMRKVDQRHRIPLMLSLPSIERPGAA